MRTGIMLRLRVRKRLCVSVLGCKRSIYFLVNIGYFLIYIYINIQGDRAIERSSDRAIVRSSDRAIERSSDRRSAVNITGKVGGQYYW